MMEREYKASFLAARVCVDLAIDQGWFFFFLIYLHWAIHGDNQSVIKHVTNPDSHARVSHIEIGHRFINHVDRVGMLAN